MSSANLIAKRYAQALFGAAKKSQTLEEVASFLSQLSQIFQDMPRGVHQVFLDPTVSKEDLRFCMATLSKESPKIVQNFCDILVQEGRLKFIEEINSTFQMLLRKSKGESVADVWAAHELPKDFYGQIEKILSHSFDRKVSLNVHQDPKLLGGVVIEAEGIRLDASVLGTLNQLSHHMKGAA
ncbi:MAG: ATP synthase F1 subunit delta [bacterium]|nr:ATP synthase F1 subunit delta [bacterium]